MSLQDQHTNLPVGFAILIHLPLVDIMLGLDTHEPITDKFFSEECCPRVFGHFDSGVIV
jgi:hypothetical protein